MSRPNEGAGNHWCFIVLRAGKVPHEYIRVPTISLLGGLLHRFWANFVGSQEYSAKVRCQDPLPRIKLEVPMPRGPSSLEAARPKSFGESFALSRQTGDGRISLGALSHGLSGPPPRGLSGPLEVSPLVGIYPVH